MHSLVEMLRYKRPEGSDTQKAFCKGFSNLRSVSLINLVTISRS